MGVARHKKAVHDDANREVFAVAAAVNVDVERWRTRYGAWRGVVQLNQVPYCAAQEHTSAGEQLQADLPQIVASRCPLAVQHAEEILAYGQVVEHPADSGERTAAVSGMVRDQERVR